MTPPSVPAYPTVDDARSHFDLEDLAWVGMDGDSNFEDLLQDKGFEPEHPLRLIVRAIIAGNGVAEGLRREREDKALAALIGSPGPGRREVDDYDLLLEIARRYRAAFWAERAGNSDRDHPKRQGPPLDPIIRAVVPDSHPRCADCEGENVRKLLARKFRADRDLLLARASSDNDFERLDTSRAIKNVLRALKRLDISADPAVLPDRRANRGPNGAI